MTKIQRWFADDLSENYEVKEDGQWVKWDDVKDLIKDAERYRWLRCGGWEVLQDPKYWTPELRFDGVIDAAMAKDGA